MPVPIFLEALAENPAYRDQAKVQHRVYRLKALVARAHGDTEFVRGSLEQALENGHAPAVYAELMQKFQALGRPDLAEEILTQAAAVQLRHPVRAWIYRQQIERLQRIAQSTDSDSADISSVGGAGKRKNVTL